MDSFEMSVTSTDCQFPGCRYVASVYTYPFCHEHEKFSPHYRPGQQGAAAAGAPAAAAAGPQKINDLNREDKRKSASLTEAPARPGYDSLERQQSRSLEDVRSFVAPEESEEPMHVPCSVSRCKLRGHPDQYNMCTQHFIEAQSSRTRRMQDNSSQTSRFPPALQDDDAPNSFSGATDVMAKCQTATCEQLGAEVFRGLCANCYISMDVGGDTEVIERKHHEKAKENADTTEVLMPPSPGNNDKKRTRKDPEDLSDKKQHLIESRDNIDAQHAANLDTFPVPSLNEAKHNASRSESHEYYECRNASCKKLAPANAAEGYCSDCSVQGIVEPPVELPVFEPTLRVDATATTATPKADAAHVRTVALQSLSSLSIKQAHPKATKIDRAASEHPASPAATTDKSAALTCSTPDCPGIPITVDKNKRRLCFSCLKAGKQVAEEGPTTTKQRATPGSGEAPAVNGEASAASPLRRLSGNRRSGRNRHTIAIAPKTKSLMDSPLSQKNCVSPLCDKQGSAQFGGFCKDCFEWMCLKFEQFQTQENRTEEMKPCVADNCQFFGTKETRGYCSQCFRKLGGKEVRFGSERRCSSGRSITPPPGARGQLCANPFCDQSGHHDFCNFCPSCFRVFDACAGIQYSPPPTRATFLPPGGGTILDSEPYWAPPQDTIPSVASIPTSFIPPASITSEVASFPSDASLFLSHAAAAPEATREPVDVTTRYREVIEGVESASRVGKSKCRVRHCKSFGNSKCNGYCNSCYVKYGLG